MPATPHPSRGPSHSPPFARDPPGPCPNGGAFSPPRSHRQGGAEGRQRRALRSLSCSAGAGPREGGVPFSRHPTIPVCAQRRVGTNPARERGRKQGAPAQRKGGAKGVRTGRGHAERGGRGCKHTVCIPHPLCTPAHVAQRGGRGGH